MMPRFDEMSWGSRWGVMVTLGIPPLLRSRVKEKGLFTSKLFQDKSLVRQVFQAPDISHYHYPRTNRRNRTWIAFKPSIPVGRPHVTQQSIKKTTGRTWKSYIVPTLVIADPHVGRERAHPHEVAKGHVPRQTRLRLVKGDPSLGWGKKAGDKLRPPTLFRPSLTPFHSLPQTVSCFFICRLSDVVLFRRQALGEGEIMGMSVQDAESDETTTNPPS